MSNILSFKVSGNRLELKDGFSPVNTEHNYTIIRVSFEQGSDWANCAVITAGFFVSADQISTIQPAATSGLTCSFTIPGEVLSSGVDEFHFGLTGSYIENGSTVTVATNIVTINARRGVLIGEAVDLSAYEKLLAAMNAKFADYYPDIDYAYFANKFVTPEMYGAVGDGRTDDTGAIQDAITNGAGKVVLIVGNYATTGTIVIEGQRDIHQVGTINYSGTDSAVKIQNVTTHSNLKFDKIIATNGNGIELYATAKDVANNIPKTYVQYVKLEFDLIMAAKKCIYLNLDAEYKNPYAEGAISDNDVGWINEIVIYGGRLSGVTVGNYKISGYGIYGDAKGYQKMNNIKIYNVSIEGIKNTLLQEGSNTPEPAVGIHMANGCKRWSFMNMRYAENFDVLMKTEEMTIVNPGNNSVEYIPVKEFVFYGPQWIANSMWDLSRNTTGIINIPTYGEVSGKITGFTRIIKEAETEEQQHAIIEQTLNTQFNNALDTIIPALNAAKAVTDRFVFKEVVYSPNNLKTLIQHKIVPAEEGFYFVILNIAKNMNSGDLNSSVYLVRVKNQAEENETPNNLVDYVIPLHEGSGKQAPRIIVDTTSTEKKYGLLQKNNSNNTDYHFLTMAIKLSDGLGYVQS